MNSPTTANLAEPGAAGFLATVAGTTGRRPAGAVSASLAPATGPLPDFSQLLNRGTGAPPAATAPTTVPVMNAAPAKGALSVSPLPMMLGQIPAAGAGEDGGSDAAQPTRETVEAAGAILLSLWQALTAVPSSTVSAGNEVPALVTAQPDATAAVPVATATVVESSDSSGITQFPAGMMPAMRSPANLPGTVQPPAALPGQIPSTAEATMPPAKATPTLPTPATPSVHTTENPVIPPAAATAPTPTSISTSTSTSTPVPAPIELELPGGVKLSLVPVPPPIAVPAEPRAMARAGAENPAPLPATGANFAASLAVNPRTTDSAVGAREKIFLSPDQQQLMQASADTGIGSANSRGNMSARHSKSAAQTTENSPVLGVTVRTATEATVAADLAPTPESAPVELRRLASQAVEAVVKLVDLQASRPTGQPATVHLRLRVAGEDLAIRVELREGAVHTSFSTDSAELRRALSDEWQVAASESQGRTLRLLEPQFVSPTRGGTEGFNAGGQSAQGQAQSRSQQEPAASPRPAVAAPPSASAAVIAPAVPSFTPTALHLTAFA